MAQLSWLDFLMYEWTRICLVEGGLDGKLQYYGTFKFSWKSLKISNSN
jgi:hypothetical protein